MSTHGKLNSDSASLLINVAFMDDDVIRTEFHAFFSFFKFHTKLSNYGVNSRRIDVI